jgi:hypothetical protein
MGFYDTESHLMKKKSPSESLQIIVKMRKIRVESRVEINKMYN